MGQVKASVAARGDEQSIARQTRYSASRVAQQYTTRSRYVAIVGAVTDDRNKYVGMLGKTVGYR